MLVLFGLSALPAWVLWLLIRGQPCRRIANFGSVFFAQNLYVQTVPGTVQSILGEERQHVLTKQWHVLFRGDGCTYVLGTEYLVPSYTLPVPSQYTSMNVAYQVLLLLY